jgi:hypothetical protein
MSVNKYKIRANNGQSFINFPLSHTTTTVGQEEIIEREFVSKETEKAINGIVDYEKVRLSPIDGTTELKRVDFSINMLNKGNFPGVTTYATEGFTNEDILYRRNNFKRSFLNLTFFDSDIPTNQNYLGNVTIFCKLSRFDLRGVEDVGVIPEPTEPVVVNEPTPEPIKEWSGFDWSFLDGIVEQGGFNFDIDLGLGSSYQSPDVTKAELSYSITNQDVVLAYKCRGENKLIFLEGLKYRITNEKYSQCSDVWFLEAQGQRLNSNTNLGIPYSYGDIIYLAKKNYEYNGRYYNVYTKWYHSLMGSTEGELKGVYLKDMGAIPTGDGSDGGSSHTPVNTSLPGMPKDVTEIPLKFIVEDPIQKPSGFAEGFYVYHEKVEVPCSIYMRASFNNAKNGLSTDLITTNQPQDIDELVKKLHVKYDLKVDGDMYYYELDQTYSDNITVTGNQAIVNLYEIRVL